MDVMVFRSAKEQAALALGRHAWFVRSAYGFWRFFQAKYTMGAAGIVIREDGCVLLVEHAFHPKHPIGLPGGWVDHREHPGRTVKRELQEELELAVQVGPIVLVDRPFANHLDIFFLCKPINKVGQLSFELVSFDWYPLDQLPDLSPVHHKVINRAQELQWG